MVVETVLNGIPQTVQMVRQRFLPPPFLHRDYNIFIFLPVVKLLFIINE